MANNNNVAIEALPLEQTFKVYFHGFLNAPTTISHMIESPKFTFMDHQWRVLLYPNGRRRQPPGMVAMYLRNYSERSVKIKYQLMVGDAKYKRTRLFNKFGADGQAWGSHTFATRSTIVTGLQNGTLIVKVRMAQVETMPLSLRPFVPPNPFPFALQKTFNDEKSADIIFMVGGQVIKEERKKKAKTTPTSFHAHRLILKECAPILADLCEGFQDKKPVSIIDTEPIIFGYLLEYVYGRDINEEDFRVNAKELIDAADKYGVVSLKLKAEACYVESTTINTENVVELLLYADSKNCALLNEAVMDYIIEHGDEVLEKITIEHSVPGAMLTDLLATMMRGKKKSTDTNSDSSLDFNTMRVSALRKMCHEKGLDFDGSRKTMVELLKNAQENSS